MVYYEAVVNNIKNIAMEVDTLCGQWKSGRTNRRFSLFDRSETKPNSSREFIETRYRKFFQSIRKSDLESSNSLEASTMERSFEEKKSIPSVRLVQKEKNKMVDILRQTLTKYNFMNLQKEKKMQVYNQKKLKYERIIKIRQENKREKIGLSQSRALLEKEQMEEKLKLKRSVDFERRFKDESMLKHISERKSMAQERKKDEVTNKFKIRLNKSKEIEHCRNRRLEIVSDEKESRKKRMLTEEAKMRMSTEGYYKKLSVEIECVEDLDRKISYATSFFKPKIFEIEKEQSILDSKLQRYSDFLKDGSTLKKINITLMKAAETKSPEKLQTMKTESNYSDEEEH